MIQTKSTRVHTCQRQLNYCQIAQRELLAYHAVLELLQVEPELSSSRHWHASQASVTGKDPRLGP